MPPAADPAACRILPHAAELDDVVFEEGLSYREAITLYEKGTLGAYPAKLERTGCETFRVVVAGAPLDAADQKSFHAEAAGAGRRPAPHSRRAVSGSAGGRPSSEQPRAYPSAAS